jgi:glyoxylase-like metal-dependent hydrolase (beta-lactamase superfamily II)
MLHDLKALSFADIEASQAILFQGGQADRFMRIDCLAWLLVGEERTILVDTGIADFDALNSMILSKGRRWEARGRLSLAEQLAGHGISPDGIDDVILTHLHYDHVSNVPLFRKARFHLSAVEWEAAGETLERVPQLHEAVACLETAAIGGRLNLLPDQADLGDGLRTVRVGGHTPGSLIVEAPTNFGPVLLAGDAVFLRKNYERGIPIGLTGCEAESEAVLDRLAAFQGQVLPGHDPLGREIVCEEKKSTYAY